MPRKSGRKSSNKFPQAHKFLISLDTNRLHGYRTDRIKAMLDKLGNPQNKYKTVHVAGTSGKGSLCQMLSHILRAAGKKTGLTLSPYLLSPSERIQINNRNITNKNFTKLIKKYKSLILEYELTYFEAYIALAFIHFAEQKVDYAVIETGLGGRLDATNVLHSPALAIVTTVGLDHIEMLGNTKRKIAREKQAIIKNERKAITGSKYIKKARYVETKDYELINLDTSGAEFIYQNKEYKLGMLGEFQVENAILAIEAARSLRIPRKYVLQGLLKAKHPGRFDVLSKKPLIIMDGAHNVDKMKAFVLSLLKIIDLYKYEKKYLLIGLKKGKDSESIVKLICPFFDEIIVSKFQKPYTVDPRSIAREVKKHTKVPVVKVENNSEQAYNKVVKRLKPNDLLIVTGSLYLIGDIYRAKK